MEIFYDLKVSDNRDCVVTVKWSTDNGNSFPLTATALVGAAGPGVVPGDGLKVTWDMGVDWNNQFTQSGRIKIIASRIPADYNPAGSTRNWWNFRNRHLINFRPTNPLLHDASRAALSLTEHIHAITAIHMVGDGWKSNRHAYQHGLTFSKETLRQIMAEGFLRESQAF